MSSRSEVDYVQLREERGMEYALLKLLDDNPEGITEEKLTSSLGVDRENRELINLVHILCHVSEKIKWYRGIYSLTSIGKFAFLNLK
jgi:hypothetical protein